jgi:DnaK suppressor protein
MERFSKVRALLEQQKKEILEGAEKVVQSSVETGVQLFPDPSDLASREEVQGFSFRLKEREKKLLRKIDEALERIAAGSFGICERCGEAIEEKRMLARPVTTFCIACKTLLESEERSEHIRR